MTNRQIAAALGIADGTVSAHLSAVRGKLKTALGPYDPFGSEDRQAIVMTTAGNNTASTREDELLAYVYPAGHRRPGGAVRRRLGCRRWPGPVHRLAAGPRHSRPGAGRRPDGGPAVLPALPAARAAGHAAGARCHDGRGGGARRLRRGARRLASAGEPGEGPGVPAPGRGEPVPVCAATPGRAGRPSAAGAAGYARRRARGPGPAGAARRPGRARRACPTGSARRSCSATTRACPRARSPPRWASAAAR